MERFIQHTRKGAHMAKVKATRDFHGSVVNRDDLGVVKEGDLVEVSENDAQYLEREGYAERVATQETPEEPKAAAPTPAETPEAPAEPEAKSGTKKK
jgi:hypothetical protein